MNRLKPEKEKMVLNLLVEGNSIRSIDRITGVDKNTVLRVLLRAGQKCQRILDSYMRNLKCDNVECDEIWTFVGKKRGKLQEDEIFGEKGDQYIFVALDRDTKLVPVFFVGKRNRWSTRNFLKELRKRVKGKIQLTTDQFRAYSDAVDEIFGIEIDYAMLKKLYHGNGNGKREGYSPSDLKGIEIRILIGNPDRKKICTSYVERQNLTIRMQMRRFTRLTNAFSKKLENLKAAVALHFYYYNFMRIHQTLRVTPAMEAGLTNKIWAWENILN